MEDNIYYNKTITINDIKSVLVDFYSNIIDFIKITIYESASNGNLSISYKSASDLIEQYKLYNPSDKKTYIENQLVMFLEKYKIDDKIKISRNVYGDRSINIEWINIL